MYLLCVCPILHLFPGNTALPLGSDAGLGPWDESVSRWWEKSSPQQRDTKGKSAEYERASGLGAWSGGWEEAMGRGWDLI